MDDFYEKEAAVMRNSEAYKSSKAFRKAMDYICDMDAGLYHELIEMEYEEAF